MCLFIWLFLVSVLYNKAVVVSTFLSSVLCRAKSLQSCPTLCDPRDYSPPGSSVLGILQARLLEWVAMPSSRGSSQPKDRTRVSCGNWIAAGFFTAEPLGKPVGHFSELPNLRESWETLNLKPVGQKYG